MLMKRCLIVSVVVVVATALVFGASTSSAQVCDPLVPEVCGYPFPNNFWRGDDGKLNFTSETFPKTHDNISINTRLGGWNDLDGFSPIPMITVFFDDMDIGNFPRWWDIETSVSSSSPSILFNVDTGEQVAHWTELDHSGDNEGKNYARTLTMWPAERLNDSSTYIVAFRNVRNSNGQLVTTSPAFSNLRDNISSTFPSVEWRRTKYEKLIFPSLQKAGFERGSLQLAFDFTVMSTHTQTNRIVTMRDDAFKRTQDGIPFSVLKVENNPRPGVARQITGVMKVPWYLTQLAPGMSVRLNVASNDSNTPLYNGEGEAQFMVVIPESLVNNKTKGAILQYGHGLFGSMSEIETSYLDNEANTYGYVVFATNWLGMCWEDEVPAASIIAEDLSDFPAIPDRSHQGMLNALLLMRLASSDELINSEHFVFNGNTVIDPTRRYYYGNSQGGIFGTVYMGVTTDVLRGVVGVAGGPYSLLLPRSADFAALFDILKVRYPDPTVRISLMTVIQLLWDRMEPSGYLHHITRDPLPNTPAHTVIGHYGLADAQVTWLGMLMIGRSIGASMFESNVQQNNETLYGFNLIPDTATLSKPGQNLVQGWYWDTPAPPIENLPASKSTDTHEKERRSPHAQAMTHRFLAEGIIYNDCGGPCTS
eukprot:m.48442 g.48442  ORF g.48442 m.48442 type:complete len:649 (-) comp7397_c0_seq1:95-2041(-)